MAILAFGLAVVILLVTASVALLASRHGGSGSDSPAAEPASGAVPRTRVELRRVLAILPRSADCARPQIWCDPRRGTAYRLGPVELSTRDIVSAQPRLSDYGQFVVTVTLSDRGAKTFEAVTRELARNSGAKARLAVVAGGTVITAPTVQGAIPGGEIDISADFSQAQAERLAAAIKP